MFLINLYQKLKTPRTILFATLGIPPHSCRHHPTCSSYTKESINKYGTILGLVRGLKRILTCNPLFSPNNHAV